MADSERLTPDFKNKDDLVISYEKNELNDSQDVPLRAFIILLSYNRPRMLREAIDSVVQQTHENWVLHILDDGSDFDVDAVIDEYKDERIFLHMFPKISFSERVTESRISANINYALEKTKYNDVIYYLCDDDIFYPSWIKRSLIALWVSPEIHMVQGASYTFNDGEDWGKDAVYGMPGWGNSDQMLFIGTGSFCHRSECYWEEGLKWKETYEGHSQDIEFIDDISNLHPNFIYLESPSIIRREHEKSLSSLLGRKDKNGLYKPGFVPGRITEDMIAGTLE